jgi:hypothetical protein
MPEYYRFNPTLAKQRVRRVLKTVNGSFRFPRQPNPSRNTENDQSRNLLSLVPLRNIHCHLQYFEKVRDIRDCQNKK